MASLDVDGHTLKVSNLDKVLYPSDGTTKADVLQHYVDVADYILPQLADRTVTRKRWPDGVMSTPFFEKNLPRGTPDWVRTVRIETPGSSKDRTHLVYPVLESRAGLVWAANLAALELHTPQWTVGPRGGVRGADRLVIDLDPGAPAGLRECVEIATIVRERLVAEGYTVVPVTSGSKGMQLYAADGRTRPPDTFRSMAKELATELEAEHADLVLSDMTRAKRAGKILLDWSQNNAAKTTITPYSLRGTERSFVAAPRAWEELDDPDLAHVHRTEMPARLETYGDLMAVLP